MYRLDYIDSSHLMAGHSHGIHAKDMVVLHETISPDEKGIADIIDVEKFLARKGYGIHGMTDLEANKAWAYGMGQDIFYHAGGVNERGIGLEQVSEVPAKSHRNSVRYELWMERSKQLHATAKMCAAIHNTKPHKVPLVFSDGLHPGITSHWNVSQHFPASEGHTDCWPHHLGGYYPMLYVIHLARDYADQGVHL